MTERQHRELPVFFTDPPLGRLTTWLRIIGCECHACPDLSPRRLVFPVSPDPGDVILTRQVNLPAAIALARPDLRCRLIRSNDWREQIREVVTGFGLSPPKGELRQCLRCGERLIAPSRESLPPRIPVFVEETVATFRECPRCHRVYWPGTHRRGIRAQLESFFPRNDAGGGERGGGEFL